ncbi:MAG: phage tail tube protein [Lachnospiraceae bacterium]|nr:phage tail tube protein [Lachnospiraceae bacterium]
MNKFNAEQVINGSYGEMWYDGEYMAEILAGKAEVGYKRTAVPQAGKMIEGQKITGLEPKGEFKIHHVNSRVLKKEQEALKKGKTAVHTIIFKVDDPDAIGAERVAFYNCVLDKMILADFENGKMSERSYGFTFDDWEILESI